MAMETVDRISQDESMQQLALECWNKLGVEALRQGNHQVVEKAAQMTKDFDRLSFLYLITGNTVKLRKMLKIAEIRKDVMSRFHNALYLGDVPERVKILEAAGQGNSPYCRAYSECWLTMVCTVYLAFLTASCHGLTEEAARLQSLLPEGLDLSASLSQTAVNLQPPTPIYRSREGADGEHTVNWPLLTVPKSAFEGSILDSYEAPDEEYADAAGDAWGDDDLLLDDDEGLDLRSSSSVNHQLILGHHAATKTQEEGGGGGWDDDDLDLGDDDLDVPLPPKASGDDDLFSAPHAGPNLAAQWVSNSSHAADHAAAGSMETSLQLLNRQIAAVNFGPLKSRFTGVFIGATSSLPGLPLATPMSVPLQRSQASDAKRLPLICMKHSTLVEVLKTAYKAFHQGKIAESLESFRQIVHSIPLVVTSSRSEANEV